jgi:hypothetical protein
MIKTSPQAVSSPGNEIDTNIVAHFIVSIVLILMYIDIN